MLFVDKLSDDGSVGIVENWNSISYNIKAINSERFNSFLSGTNQETNMDCVGRYICLITGSLDSRNMVMTFFDCNNDLEKAKEVCITLKSRFEYVQMFMHFFNSLKESYERKYNNFRLKIGEPVKG